MVGVIRTSSDVSPRHSEYPLKPPRPRNSWILYRQEHCKQFTQNNPGIPQSQVSKLIAQQWKNERPEVRRHWEQKAEEEKTTHALKYPGYRYSPSTKVSKTKQKEAAKQQKKARCAQKSTLVDTNADATINPVLPFPSSSPVLPPHPLPNPTVITPDLYSNINAGATVNPAFPVPLPSTVPSSHPCPAPITTLPNPYPTYYAPDAGYMLSGTASLTPEGPADTSANASVRPTVNLTLAPPSPSTVPSPDRLSGSTVITPNPYFMPHPPNAGYTPLHTTSLAHHSPADANLGATMIHASTLPSPAAVPSPYDLPGPTVNPYFIPCADTNTGATVTPTLPFPLPSTGPSPLSGSTANPYFIPYTDTNTGAAATLALPSPPPPTVPSPYPLRRPATSPYFIPYTHNATYNTLPRTTRSTPLAGEGSTLPRFYPQNTQGMINFNIPFDRPFLHTTPPQASSSMSQGQPSSIVNQFSGMLNGQ